MSEKGKMLTTTINIMGQIDPSLQKTIADTQKRIKKLTPALAAATAGALAMKGAFSLTKSVIALTGTAAIEAGKYLKDLGSQFDEAADAIRIGTGATGDALDGLLDDFDEVYKSVPTTMEDASKAIADYNTRLGLTGPQLQEISKQALQVSDMLGDDLGGVIEESSQAFQQWNIDADNMGGAMDYIFKVSQSTGMGFTDLMSNMQKFGPQLQEMGYSFETASALMGQLDKAGVNTEEVLSAMKKSVGALAKEGISASDGLAMYYEQIKNAGTAAEAASIASEIFGTKAGSTMAAAIRDGTLAVGDLTESLLENGETIAGAAEDTYDFAERLQIMKQGLEVALKPMANTVFDGLNKFMPTLQKLMEQITPVISDAVNAAMPFVDDFLTGAATAIESVAPMVTDLASRLFPVLTELMSTLLPPILDLVNALFPAAMQILDEVIIPLTPFIVQIVDALLPPLVSLLNAVLPLLTPLLSVLKPVADVLATIAEWIGKIVDFGAGVIEKIAGLFGGGSGSKLSAPQGYATGGFTSGPSIAGEDPRYPTEAVISFNPAYRAQNLTYWQRAGQMLGASPESDYELLSGGSSTSVVYDLSGLSFSPQIKIEGDTDENALIRKLRELEPEFIDFVLEALSRREGGAYVTADSRLY
jgi:phage-related minor tail protein